MVAGAKGIGDRRGEPALTGAVLEDAQTLSSLQLRRKLTQKLYGLRVIC